MTSDTRVGRVLGALLLIHLTGGLILPYVLLNTAMTPPAVVEHAALHAATLRTVAGLFVLSAGLVLSVAILAWPIVRRQEEHLATACLALAIANLPLQLVEGGTVLTILSLSERFGTSAGDVGLLQAVGAAAVIARRWAHFTQLFTVVSWLLLLYLTLWRTALVPRPLAALGVVTTLLQMGGVPVRALLGYSPITELAMPLAPVHAALGVWLLARGLRPVPPASRAGNPPVPLGAG